METRILILLKKKIDFELSKKFHISKIPFHIITEYVFIHLDHISILSFLYVMKQFYHKECDFAYQAILNFMIGSLYDSIHRYAHHMFTSCRHSSIQHIFLHWSPFSTKTIQPIATLTWSEFYPHSNIFIKHKVLQKQAKNLVKKKLLQSRLCIHEQTTDRNFYTTKLNPRFSQYRIQNNPSYIMLADCYTCIYSGEWISLSNMIC